MPDILKVGDKVWVVYPKYRKKPDDLTGRRKAKVCFIHERYITLWVEAGGSPLNGWKECFMYQEIISGKIVVIPRDQFKNRDKEKLKI